jgi:hypothetical protein
MLAGLELLPVAWVKTLCPPADDPYTPQELTATILDALGIDPRKRLRTH